MVRKKPRVSFPVFSPVDRNLCIIFVKIIRKHPNITLLHFTISWYQITYCKPFHSIKVRNYHQISILLGSRCRWWKWRGQPLLQLPVSQNMSFLSISHISICVPNIEEVITRLMVTMAMTKKLMEKSVSFHLLNSPSWMLCLRFVSPGVARSCGDKVVLIFSKYYDSSPNISTYMTWHAPRVTSCYTSPLSSSPGLEELVQGKGKYVRKDGGEGGPDEEGAFVKVLRLRPQKDVSRRGSNVLAAV